MQIKEIQIEGDRYGLKLNTKKCEYMCFGNPARIVYQNGEKVPFKEEVKYLGVLINDQANTNKEISAKISGPVALLRDLPS